MGIEQLVNQKLNKYPGIKKRIKRIYQRTMYAISHKIKSEGKIVRVSPVDSEHEYFFGYYDKSPWDALNKYMLCLKADDTWSDVSPKSPATILVIDTFNNNKVYEIAKTYSWNVQQGCMLQWLGPDYDRKVIYNDFRDGKYCSIIITLEFNATLVEVIKEDVIPFPIYSVAENGSFALSLDFSRLNRLRPGYGYYNVIEETTNEKLPSKPCIWSVNLRNGEVKPLLKYTDFASFQPRKEMLDINAEHKVNHIMLNPSGDRFMVLYRWFNGKHKYTRLITCNVDCTEMYLLADDDMVSHCFWKDDEHILAFENKEFGAGYYLMKDKTQDFEHLWPDINDDGHPSYSPDRDLVVTDTYPDRARMASIKIMNGLKNEKVRTIARVFAPFKYDNDTRCDLHPRWSRDGRLIAFDSVFEKHRGLYILEVEK